MMRRIPRAAAGSSFSRRFELRLTPANHETKKHSGRRGLGRWTFSEQ